MIDTSPTLLQPPPKIFSKWGCICCLVPLLSTYPAIFGASYMINQYATKPGHGPIRYFEMGVYLDVIGLQLIMTGAFAIGFLISIWKKVSTA